MQNPEQQIATAIEQCPELAQFRHEFPVNTGQAERCLERVWETLSLLQAVTAEQYNFAQLMAKKWNVATEKAAVIRRQVAERQALHNVDVSCPITVLVESEIDVSKNGVGTLTFQLQNNTDAIIENIQFGLHSTAHEIECVSTTRTSLAKRAKTTIMFSYRIQNEAPFVVNQQLQCKQLGQLPCAFAGEPFQIEHDHSNNSNKVIVNISGANSVVDIANSNVSTDMEFNFSGAGAELRAENTEGKIPASVKQLLGISKQLKHGLPLSLSYSPELTKLCRDAYYGIPEDESPSINVRPVYNGVGIRIGCINSTTPINSRFSLTIVNSSCAILGRDHNTKLADFAINAETNISTNHCALQFKQGQLTAIDISGLSQSLLLANGKMIHPHSQAKVQSNKHLTLYGLYQLTYRLGPARKIHEPHDKPVAEALHTAQLAFGKAGSGAPNKAALKDNYRALQFGVGKVDAAVQGYHYALLSENDKNQYFCLLFDTLTLGSATTNAIQRPQWPLKQLKIRVEQGGFYIDTDEAVQINHNSVRGRIPLCCGDVLAVGNDVWQIEALYAE